MLQYSRLLSTNATTTFSIARDEKGVIESATKNSPADAQLGGLESGSIFEGTAVFSCSTYSKRTQDATSTFSKAPRPSLNLKSIEVTPDSITCGAAEETDFVGTAAPGCPGEQSSPAHSAGDASEAGDQLSQAVLETDGRGRLFTRSVSSHFPRNSEALRTDARYFVGSAAGLCADFVSAAR
jgi:hypothetical protein